MGFLQITIKLIYKYIKIYFINTKEFLFKMLITTESTIENLGEKNTKPKEEQRRTRKNI